MFQAMAEKASHPNNTQQILEMMVAILKACKLPTITCF